MNSIEARTGFVEERVAALEERRLFAGADTAAAAVTVLAVQTVDSLEPLDDAAEGHERLFVVAFAVVAQVDEPLGVAGVVAAVLLLLAWGTRPRPEEGP